MLQAVDISGSQFSLVSGEIDVAGTRSPSLWRIDTTASQSEPREGNGLVGTIRWNRTKGNSARTAELRSAPTAQLYLTFRQLVEEWHKERGATSSITKMAMCRSYLRIIAMGDQVIPMIIRQMENEGDEPDMWFWALQILTGSDPVPDEARGDIVEMARAWIDWGRTRYAW
jgi:hypothetical protein